MIARFIITLMVAMAILGNVSMSSLSPSTIDLSKIDRDKVVYSTSWGLDKTLEVIRHCTGADKEVRSSIKMKINLHKLFYMPVLDCQRNLSLYI